MHTIKQYFQPILLHFDGHFEGDNPVVTLIHPIGIHIALSCLIGKKKVT